MYAVVNRLPLKDGADWQAIASRFDKFVTATRRNYPKLMVAVVYRASDKEAVFVGIYEDKATAEHVSANVAAPWFAENIRQYLSGPAQRSVGAVVAGEVGG